MRINTDKTTAELTGLQIAMGIDEYHVKTYDFPDHVHCVMVFGKPVDTGADVRPVYIAKCFRGNMLINNPTVTFATVDDALLHGACYCQRVKTIAELFDRDVPIPVEMTPECLNE